MNREIAELGNKVFNSLTPPLKPSVVVSRRNHKQWSLKVKLPSTCRKKSTAPIRIGHAHADVATASARKRKAALSWSLLLFTPRKLISSSRYIDVVECSSAIFFHEKTLHHCINSYSD